MSTRAKPKKSTAKAKKKLPGRPSTFTPRIAEEICGRIAEGEPLAEICRDPKMPATRTVSDWRRHREEFDDDFQRARDEGFDALAVECLRIADDTSRDTIETENGPRPDNEWIARSRLRIDTRLKLLSKWDPKRYGERVEIEQDSNVELVVTIGGNAD
ncbi:MAG: hypothetical protein V4819_00975 [Verrucomicrobiota bacterium]